MLQDKNIQIKIVDAKENILSGLDPRLVKTSEKVLTSKDIEIMTKKKIKDIVSNSIVLESGDKIRSDCTIWTAGVKGRSIKIVPEIEKTECDTIPVDKHFDLFGFENVFSIGDIFVSSKLQVINTRVT